jgi:hypothetical protein
MRRRTIATSAICIGERSPSHRTAVGGPSLSGSTVGELAISVTASVVMALMVLIGGMATEGMTDVSTASVGSASRTLDSVILCRTAEDELVCIGVVPWGTAAGGNVQ